VREHYYPSSEAIGDITTKIFSVYIHYLKIIYWVRFKLFCISFVYSSRQYWVRPCLPSHFGSFYDNLIRLSLIKFLIKIINFRFLITELSNAQICSKMPFIELSAGRELSDIVSSIDKIGQFL
jgi:hypothetical protein